MWVQEVKIENLKCFRSGRFGVDLDLQRSDGSYAGWTVVAGRNGAGKSSFLQAIALSASGTEAARSLQESWAGWIRDGASSGMVATRIRPSEEDRFKETGRQPKQFWTGLEWELSSSGPEPIMSFHQETSKSSARTASRGPWGENPDGWLIAGYGPFRRLSSAASDAQRLMLGAGHISRLVSLSREDASLSESVRWLQDIYLRRLEKREGSQELEDLVLELNESPDGRPSISSP